MPQTWWDHRRVVVTGGAGFLGSHVVEELQRRGCGQIVVPRKAAYDLRNMADVIRLYDTARPDVVIHLAATVGGIGANRQHPADYFYNNAIMGLQVIEQARRFGVEKLVCMGTVCSYPKVTRVPFVEADLWNGYPEETNAPYGVAKKMLLVQLQAYRQQYGFNGVYLISANLYGPRDTFDPGRSHVIPALIRKCLEAKQGGQPFTVWGTGTATREFLYVEDAARAIVLAAERYSDPEPLNLGASQEVRIRDVVELIKDIVGYTGEVRWDPTQPDGQPRRSINGRRAHAALGWSAQVPLREGLERTVAWVLRHGDAATPMSAEPIRTSAA